jgi:4-hydroxybenzoate polyprenyltransferase
MRAVGRLLRLSLAPSAAADVVAGLVFAGNGAFPGDARAWWLVPASLGVYHGALALNDWNDREHDARTRPARPIPSGDVAPGAALILGLALVLGGLACAYRAGAWSAAWMGGVAVLALSYDFFGRGAWSGPLLLALCRAGNLGSGIFWVLRARESPPDPWLWLPCVAYGLYVLVVSRLGRMEDAEDAAPLGSRPSMLLVMAASCLFLPLLVPQVLALERAAALALAVAAASGLVHAARRHRPWTRPLVEREMGACLRRLMVFAAIVALLRASREHADAWIAAAAILGGYALAHALRRLFPPT